MTKPDFTKLSRPIHPMPDMIREALEEHRLMVEYFDRPAYQQNDCVGWITRAKRTVTQAKRLNQMLDELCCGDVYMKMAWRPRTRRSQ